MHPDPVVGVLRAPVVPLHPGGLLKAHAAPIQHHLTGEAAIEHRRAQLRLRDRARVHGGVGEVVERVLRDGPLEVPLHGVAGAIEPSLRRPVAERRYPVARLERLAIDADLCRRERLAHGEGAAGRRQVEHDGPQLKHRGRAPRVQDREPPPERELLLREVRLEEVALVDARACGIPADEVGGVRVGDGHGATLPRVRCRANACLRLAFGGRAGIVAAWPRSLNAS